MLQNVCFRCPDRSDYRAKVANSVIEVLAHLSPKYIRVILIDIQKIIYKFLFLQVIKHTSLPL